MGHRKKNAPRHGSLAYLPRGRARSLIPVVKTWPKIESEKPTLLGLAAFKAGTIHVYTIDDREKTPNYGKPLFNMATVLEVPPVFISGLRMYEKSENGLKVFEELYTKNQPKELARKKKLKNTESKKHWESLQNSLDRVKRLSAVCCLTIKDTDLPQKTPILFEVQVGGGIMESQLEYVKSIIGKYVKISDIWQAGMYVDSLAVTKGKGFEGPVTRLGIKRKQHKSRKTVRAVGTIGPWNPSATMYTVPSAGQRGFHRRTEYNKRIIMIGDSDEKPITPLGGFPHYGFVKSEYLILRGSVQGPPKRLVKIRSSIRPPTNKIQPPKILEVSTAISR